MPREDCWLAQLGQIQLATGTTQIQLGNRNNPDIAREHNGRICFGCAGCVGGGVRMLLLLVMLYCMLVIIVILVVMVAMMVWFNL